MSKEKQRKIFWQPIALDSVKQFYVYGSTVRERGKSSKKKRYKSVSCDGCRYLTESGRFCTLSIIPRFKKGKCIDKEF